MIKFDAKFVSLLNHLSGDLDKAMIKLQATNYAND